MLRRYTVADAFRGRPYPAEPFVYVFKTLDIPATMEKAFRNLRRVAPQCCGIAFYRVSPGIDRKTSELARRCGFLAVFVTPRYPLFFANR